MPPGYPYPGPTPTPLPYDPSVVTLGSFDIAGNGLWLGLIVALVVFALGCAGYLYWQAIETTRKDMAKKVQQVNTKDVFAGATLHVVITDSITTRARRWLAVRAMHFSAWLLNVGSIDVEFDNEGESHDEP